MGNQMQPLGDRMRPYELPNAASEQPYGAHRQPYPAIWTPGQPYAAPHAAICSPLYSQKEPGSQPYAAPHAAICSPVYSQKEPLECKMHPLCNYMQPLRSLSNQKQFISGCPKLAFNIGIQDWYSTSAFNIDCDCHMAFNIGIQH